ncbi:MAG: galactose oxidase-like domain-containing protein, partial [Marmoricola sp.]
DPGNGALTSVPVPYDAFCSAHLVDANGDVIVFGGTVRYKSATSPWIGSNKVYKFVVATNTWVALPSMKQGRWYPTTVMDAQNRFLTYSGQDGGGAVPPTHEMYDPAAKAWTPLANRSLPMYPSLHLLRDGRLAYTGAYYGWTNVSAKPAVFNPASTSGVVVSDPQKLLDLPHRNAAMSALVGSADKQLVWVAGGGFPPVRSTYFIDLNTSSPSVVAGPSLPAAKGYVSVSHLPDLTALETGGGAGYNSPVFEASILDTNTRRLTSMAPPTVPRTYHSSSVTLPDGRVVTFGGDPSGDANFELRIEIFSPPYLFKGTRPSITSTPTEVAYGGSPNLSISGTGPFAAVIMRPGSATHSLDANQRVLKLTATAVPGGVRVTLPTNRNLAPPGWYLLFVNDGAGRPSVGRWIHLT